MTSISGVSGMSVVSPNDFIKAQLPSSPVQNGGIIVSVVSTGRSIVSSSGISGLWREFGAAAVKIAPKQGIATSLSFDQKLMMAATSGVSGMFFVYPIDIIKTQLQSSPAQNSGFIRSVVSTGRSIVSSSGIPGLWRGFGAAAIGIAPEKGITIGFNDGMRDYFSAKHPDQKLSLIEEISAGTTAGVVQLLITVPYEHVKIKLQLSTGKTVTDVVREIGVRNIFRGFSATFLRDVPFCILFFPLYSNMKTLISRGAKDEPFHAGLISGMVSGTFAGIITTPGDMLKTVIQGGNGRYTTMSICSKVVQKEGAAALFRGWNSRGMIAGLSYGLITTVFEFQKRLLA
eukprot:CAMPEP_0182426716 /NCGR_PEP_ID=MMETSP1167-20130531/13233_1 /TAXON_ID=2988 /ORGANISM="Mallomonas Sp, Strain CCMP3275" /LENGTH=343 /DNA_ID=CAMNT_0024608367 /DNA_START=29 /DNA_END=1060 /DNA_ORIENTATION=-